MDLIDFAAVDAQSAADHRRARTYAINRLREQGAKARGNRLKLEELAFRCWELGITERTIIAAAMRLTVYDLRDVVRREIVSEHQYEEAISASYHGE